MECGKFDMTFNEIDVKNIDDFTVLIRYPDSQIVPEISETKFFFKIAKEIKEKVEKEIFLSPGL